MDAKNLFDFHAYLEQVTSKNKLCRREGFRLTTCSGINGLEGLLQQFQQTANFIAIDDITTGSTTNHSGGWFERRTFTVFILMRHRFGDEQDRQDKLMTCRRLKHQLQSRFILDQADLNNELVYLGVDNMPASDMAQYFLNGCTGLYFMVNVDEPVDLSYDAQEWE